LSAQQIELQLHSKEVEPELATFMPTTLRLASVPTLATLEVRRHLLVLIAQTTSYLLHQEVKEAAGIQVVVF
jgi:hypothetical protein